MQANLPLEPHQLVAAALGDRSRHTELQKLLSTQIKDRSRPWDGCFAASPSGNIPWQDGWDPNSRALVSLLLCIGLAHDRWPENIRAKALEAALYAAKAEVAQNRLPYTYTNVAVSLAATCSYLGSHFGEADLGEYSLDLIDRITLDRVQRDGFSEFSSPTYLGLSLLGASFMEQFTGNNLTLVDQLSSDLADCWSPDIFDFVGTSMRSYGPSVHTHFSLSMLALGSHASEAMYNAPSHTGDSFFRTAFDLIKPFNPARGYVRSDAGKTISGVASLTRSRIASSAHLEAVTFEAGMWHHQATSVSVHTKGGALVLRHPSIEASVRGGSVEWHRRSSAQEDGNPLWLWGALNRPVKQPHQFDQAISTQGWNISLLDSTHIQVGMSTFKVAPPLDTSKPTLDLNAEEGSLTVI